MSQPNSFIDGYRLIDGTELNDKFGNPVWSMDPDQVATAGGTVATSKKITDTITNISSAAAYAGVSLPQANELGRVLMIVNSSASTIVVYALGGSTIDGTPGNVGVQLPGNTAAFFTSVEINQWLLLPFLPFTFVSNGVYIQESIATLRLWNVSAFDSPLQMSLVYNNVLGDGGGIFYLDAADVTSPDNGTTVIVDAAGNRWKREEVEAQYIASVSAGTLTAANVQAAIDQLAPILNIAALRTTTVVNNLAVNVEGYYVAGDAGGGQFFGVTSGGPFNDNGGTIITPGGISGSATAWMRVGLDAATQIWHGDPISVKWFGAKGDGVADDSTAAQAAIDTVQTLGGSLVFPPGKYLFGSQVTIDRTFAPFGSEFVGERNLVISGYGAEIRTSGAISAFDIKGGWIPNYNSYLQGFTIYHRNNTQAVAGIRLIGAALVTCMEISVAVSSSLPAGYAAFSLENADPADSNTGCFWCNIQRCAIRPWTGSDGVATYGAKLMGAANATTLRDNNFSGATTHIALMPHPGQTSSPNSVNIDGNFFEGPINATAILLDSQDPLYHVTGTRITNNRFESIDTAVELTGIGVNVQVPTYMSGNYGDTSVVNYVVNTLNVPIIILDFALVGAPIGPSKIFSNEGVFIQNYDAAADPLTLKVPNLNRGLALQDPSGNVIGSLIFSNAAGGVGMQIRGTVSPYRPLTLTGCQGIAAQNTSANNLTGRATFAAATTFAVTFSIAEADANYSIFIDSPENNTFWVTGKATTGFTINAASATSVTVGWLLIRYA